MKRRLRYIITSALAVLLMLALLCGTASASSESSADPLHFGISGMGSNESLAASELFSNLFGEAPTASEKEYLDSLSGITFIYNDAIPDSLVSTDYNGEAGTLELSMYPYTFTAANGVAVTWIPQYASLETQTVAFSSNPDGSYRAVLNGLFHTDDFDVKIEFAWTAEVPAEAVDALLTSPYKAAEDALKIIQAYEAEYAVWYAANERFLAYQAYTDAVKAYEQYLKDLQYYNEVEMPAYKEYLEILAVQKLYDDWEHYKAYEAYLNNDLEKRQAYLAYLAQVDKVKAKLEVLENLFVTDSNGWQLYASLMGNTVTEVVSQKEKLMVAGVPPEVVDAAGDATEVLRVLMKGYADLREAEYASEHARVTALYAYYTANYTEIRDQFSKLYGSLHTLHDNSLVVAELSRRGKLEHYRQFVGELYVTRTTLDDSFTRSSDWLIGKQTLTDVVEALNIVPDTNNANPTGVSMPAVEVPVVEEVTPIEKPLLPQPQTRPDPDYMAEPVKPAEVKDPDADPSTIPPYAESAGTAPTAPEMDAALKALAEDLRSGTLPKRAALGTAKHLTLTTEMVCPVSINNEMTVTFYAADGKTVLDRQKLEYGSRIIYRGPDTARAPDAQYVYTFSAWVLADGTAPEEMVLTKNLSLYAYYHTAVRYYTVTWVLDGEIKRDSLPYGEMPRCPFVTEREDDEYYTYEFSGWDREIVPVTADTTYTGSIKQTQRLYTVTWQLGDLTFTQQEPYGTYPTFEGSTDRATDEYLYTFLGWSSVITVVREDVTYTAEYSKTPLAVAEDGSILTVVHSDTTVTVKSDAEMLDIREAANFALGQGKDLTVEWDGFSVTVKNKDLSVLTGSFCRKLSATASSDGQSGTLYSVTFRNSAGHLVELALPLTLRTLESGAGCYLQNGETWERIEDEAVLNGAFAVRIRKMYGISVDPTENCYISELPLQAEAGSTVDLRIGCTFGYHVSAARVTTQDGREVEIRDLCFVMPEEAVRVELTVTKIIYHVTFIADGKVISEADYCLGETIVFPDAPEKASDEAYNYTFSGWSKDLTLAMGDDLSPVYEAIYTATDRNAIDPFLSGGNNDWVVTVALPIFLGVVLLGVGGFVFLKLRKKKKNAKIEKTVSGDSDMFSSSEETHETDDASDS